MPVCPFCGVVSAIPHESQQVCVDALAAEIARLRQVLERPRPTTVPIPARPAEDGPDDN
jgi:hypothetical protein